MQARRALRPARRASFEEVAHLGFCPEGAGTKAQLQNWRVGLKWRKPSLQRSSLMSRDEPSTRQRPGCGQRPRGRRRAGEGGSGREQARRRYAQECVDLIGDRLTRPVVAMVERDLETVG